MNDDIFKLYDYSYDSYVYNRKSCVAPACNIFLAEIYRYEILPVPRRCLSWCNLIFICRLSAGNFFQLLPGFILSALHLYKKNKRKRLFNSKAYYNRYDYIRCYTDWNSGDTTATDK